MDKNLANEIERLKGRQMTPADIAAQRESFVYGNAPGDDRGTRETVRQSLEMECAK